MGDATAIFSIHDQKDDEIHEVVQQVYDALKEKGYNPVNQLVGYILSEDPTYITTYKGARSLIRKIDRDDLLQAMLRSYLNVRIIAGLFAAVSAKESAVFCCCPGGRAGPPLRELCHASESGIPYPALLPAATGSHPSDTCFGKLPFALAGKAYNRGSVKIWFTTVSYSQGSRSLRSCFSSRSEPSKRWMR